VTQFTADASNGIVIGQSYQFYVISVNVIGNSAASGTLSNVISANVPTVPLNLIRATTVTPVDSKITLDWDPSSSSGGSDILTYEIWWNGGTIAGPYP
jgi:hypothetical protein